MVKEKEAEKEKDSHQGPEKDQPVTLVEFPHFSSSSRSSMSFFLAGRDVPLGDDNPNRRNSSSSNLNPNSDDAVAHKIKLVVVGDNMDRHKTEFLNRYVHDTYKKDDPGPAWEPYCHRHVLENEGVVEVHLGNTEGREEYDGLRPLDYSNADVVVLLYSVSDPASYDNIREKWSSEVKHHCPDAVCILVASKVEDRENPMVVRELQQKELDPITFEKGAALAEKIGAQKFFECSVTTGENVRGLLHAAIKLTVQRLPVIPLIKELRKYAKDRKAEGEGFRWFWGDFFGGKPGSVKVQAANDLADELDAHGINLQREFSQDELDTFLGGDLGDKLKKYPEVVANLNRNLQPDPVAGNIQSAERRLSH